MKNAKTKSSRSNLIDYLRGIALLLAFFNHLALFFPVPRSLLPWTYEGLGYFSFAEIFIAIAAFALLHSSAYKSYLTLTKKDFLRKAISRFKTIYIAHFLILTAVIPISLFNYWNFRGHAEMGTYYPLKSYFLGVILLFQPQLIDILPGYLLLTIANLLIIPALWNNKQYQLFFGSLIIWMVPQFCVYPQTQLYPYGIVLPYFNPFAWQFLYVLLIFILSKRDVIKSHSNKFFLISLIICLGGVIIHHSPEIANTIPYILIGRQNMGILRVINFLGFIVICICLKQYTSKFLNSGSHAQNSISNRFFVWIGQHTLSIFSFHVVVYHIVKILVLPMLPGNSSSLNQVLICTAFIFLPLVLQFAKQQLYDSKKNSYSY